MNNEDIVNYNILCSFFFFSVFSRLRIPIVFCSPYQTEYNTRSVAQQTMPIPCYHRTATDRIGLSVPG